MRRKTDKLVVVCAAICILCVAVVAVVSATVLDSKAKAQAAKEATAQIQKERARNIRTSCEAQNDRHDGSIDTLNRVVLERLTGEHVPVVVPPREVKIRLAAAMKLADPPVRVQIQQSIGSTSLLIDALAPRRDCEELVRLQVNTKKK